MATRTISNAGGNWNSTGAWTEGAVPVEGDDIVATGTSGNLAINVYTAKVKSFNLTGYVGTLSGSSLLYVGPTSGTTICLFAGTINWTGILKFGPSIGATINFTSGGKTLTNITYTTLSGSISQQDALTLTGYMNIPYLDWDSNGYNITTTYVTANTSNVKNFSGSTITLIGTDSTVWNSTGGTFTAPAEIIVTNSSSSYKIITGGQTFNILTINSGNDGDIRIKDSNTFTTLTVGEGTTIQFESGTTQTITNFTITGTELAPIVIESTDSSQHTLSKSSGTVTASYCSISNSNATGGAVWNALGMNNFDFGGNSGWLFTRKTKTQTIWIH